MTVLGILKSLNTNVVCSYLGKKSVIPFRPLLSAKATPTTTSTSTSKSISSCISSKFQFEFLLGSQMCQHHSLLASQNTSRDESKRTITSSASLNTDKWYQKIMKMREPIDTPSKTQSKLLSDLDSVYELQIHKVKPENMLEYLKQFEKFASLMNEKKTGAELLASFTVLIGDQDEAVHLWKYKGGYTSYSKALMIYRTDEDIVAYRSERNAMLRERYNQILLRFGFWEFNKNREPGNLYELRSYELKSGSMIEWGNHWARGLKYRQQNGEAVCGFFSHIGDLNMCHHLWSYKSLQSRKETRDLAWQLPGWDENVRYTVPLIRSLKSRILIPTPYSPLQ